MASSVVYATADELRDQSDMKLPDRDEVISLMLSGASRMIDRVCNRPDGFEAPEEGTEREFPGYGSHVLRIDENVGVDLVEGKQAPDIAEWTAWAAADWALATGDPKRPIFGVTPYTLLLVAPTGAGTYFYSGRSYGAGGWPSWGGEMGSAAYAMPTVRVTGRWGYAAVVPDDIKMATIITASRWMKRGQSGWADSIGDGDTGMLMFRKTLDPDVLAILKAGRYIRPAVG